MSAAALLAATVLVGTGQARALLAFRLLDFGGTAVRWSAVKGKVPRVTYAVVDGDLASPKARNCAGMTAPDGLLARSNIGRAAFDSELRAAFDLWQHAIAIEFVAVDDPASANILIGAQSEPEGHAFANVDYRDGTDVFREIERSLICLNPTKQWKIGFGGSLAVYDLRYTLAHEIGHAIGLDHPEASGQLMSFTYKETFRNLQAGDVEGAIRIYGARSQQPLLPQPASARGRALTATVTSP